VGIEARLRATEARLAAANGLDVKERWVDIASPAVRVRVLESGAGAGRLPHGGERVLLDRAAEGVRKDEPGL